jgi:hypothetical protein
MGVTYVAPISSKPGFRSDVQEATRARHHDHQRVARRADVDREAGRAVVRQRRNNQVHSRRDGAREKPACDGADLA